MLSSSPHGSVMSCQSLATRAFPEPDKDSMTHSVFHRSVRFSSESRSSTRTRATSETECKKETSGSISLSALATTPVCSQSSAMSQSVPNTSAAFDLDDMPAPPEPSCRFPKLEECAHFHYERVSLGGLSIEVVPCQQKGEDWTPGEGWICLKVRSHVNSHCDESIEPRAPNSSWTEATEDKQWTLTRNMDNLLHLDDMLHRCIYDRKVSGLPNLSEKINQALVEDESEYRQLISDYVHHLSIIADDSINCGPVLNWLQMDNKGHKLLVANEDSSSINTPAVAAAYSVRKYVSQARDEISFEVGDMISIIDMPGPQESLWWRGKRGFRVGFFPHHCVAVIGDKVPRHMTQPPPIVGSVAVTPMKPVLRKHGKLISLFRSFILARPSRRSLKQQGILKERVFGCDLGEHLLNCGHEVPSVLVECAAAIESRGAVDGIYRLSGGSGLTQRLRVAFDQGECPDLGAPQVVRDPHAVSSLLKMYFRELPNPLCTYQLYDSFVSAVQQPDEGSKLRAMRETVIKLPPPHYRTLAYLMRHLRRVSLLGQSTGMTARNMAIVWAPNLLRTPASQHALQGVAQQAVITEFLICYAEELFAQEQEDSGPESLEQEVQVELRGHESSGRRPKSLPLNPPTKLLSLEEARRRGGVGTSALSPRLPPPSGAIAAAAHTQLRPEGHLKPKYIEVGSGPNNLPQYHTVLDLPAPGIKRGLKRSPSGWRGLFSRSKLQRHRSRPSPIPISPPAEIALLQQDTPMLSGLRPVKSCESLTSDTDTLAPLNDRISAPLKHHTRSSSCDSYFEPWQAELADMRLRLSPQERDRHMFSEEDDTQHNHHPLDSFCSTPAESGECSVEPSPRRNLKVDIDAANELAERQRTALEDQIADMVFIDGDSPRSKPSAEKRHVPRPVSPQRADVAKRVCKDRDSPQTSQADFQTSISNVKLRERSSPRKAKNTSRYSNMHFVNNAEPPSINSRLSWHGKDGHSTLIKIDWPENTSISTLTTSTIQSSPLTPVTPLYDTLESDSEASTANKHTIKIRSDDCQNCVEEKCLKCELKATDYENVNNSAEISPVTTDISYQNLNRLSASSNSENDKKNYENCEVLPVMTSSHESSSSYSNMSPTKQNDELYECYNFARPNYINLQSSSTSKSSTSSPLRSPLKSTISITFRSPTKASSPDYEPIENTDTPTNERDSVYEDVDLDKNLSIVEEASVPQVDASLPTQQACQPESFEQDLIILETPTPECKENDVDVYSQVKFFKKSIDEVNALILESPENDVVTETKIEESNVESPEAAENMTVEELEKDIFVVEPSTSDDKLSLGSINKEEIAYLEPPERECAISVSPDPGTVETPDKEAPHYENVDFDPRRDYVNIDTLKTCDKQLEISKHIDNTTVPKDISLEKENGNIIKPKVSNLNVRELANRFESPTEQKGPFNFEKVKYSTLDRKEENKKIKKDLTIKLAPPLSPKTYSLAKNSCTARSLDENAFVKEFGNDKSSIDRRKSFEARDVKKQSKFLPDLNLNMEENEASKDAVTPTTENKISLVQKPDTKNLIPFDTEKKLSRERIEKYKEERRNFLREKYSSQSFRSSPEQLTRIKIKKEEEKPENVTEDLPKFERRNTVDLGQRMRFSLARSSNNLDTIQSPNNAYTFDEVSRRSAGRKEERKEKVSPSYNIRDMTAMFEQKSQNNG